MSRFAAALAAGLAATGALAVVAAAHQGNPNFISVVDSVSPELRGLDVQVLNRDDRLELRNLSSATVVVEGYNDEPYVRLRPDGTVEVNRLSPAVALNKDRYGAVSTPESADTDAPPQWDVVAKTGRFEWHDHRIHWMAKGDPPQVTDRGERTKVFDWKVPFEAGGRAGAVTGTLFWVPEEDSGGPPVGAIVAFAVLLAGSAAAVVVVRRRRREPAGGGDREAW